MKYKVNKIFIALLAIAAFSCSDLIERPVGILAPESYFATTGDLQDAVHGAYGGIASEPLFGRQFSIALMLRGDMVDIGDRGTPAARQQVNDFNMDDFNGMMTLFWPRWYLVIGAANTAIDGAKFLDAPESEVNPIVAEARFIRAFSYYHLVRCFGDIPYINFFVTDPLATFEISKTPASQVYEEIIADLEFAKEWLPNKHGGSEIRSRATKGTAASYLASVHLTLQNYQEAYNEAKWVIDNRADFGYELEADFQDLFRAEIADNLKETIFTTDFLGLVEASGAFNQDFMGSMTGIRGADRTGWSVAVPSMAVYNTWNDMDYRKKVSMADSAIIGGELKSYTAFANTQRPHIAKYFRFPGTAQAEFNSSDHNFILMRYAEVLLIAAEALAEVSGPNAEAVDYVNQIRERARNWPVEQSTFPEDVSEGLNKEDFINLVLEERRLELAFEYKRWYDIKRRNLGVEVFTGPNSLEQHANFDPARDYLMPLPRRDIDLNQNLLPQNPGY